MYSRNLYLLILVIFCTFVVSVSPAKISEHCLKCICEATSGCTTSLRCFSVRNKTYCGPYQISEEFWIDAGRPGYSYESCAVTKQCSEIAIRAYLNIYSNDCNNDGVIDCLDYAIIHKMGPKCENSSHLLVTDYWNAFTETTCYSSDYEKRSKIIANAVSANRITKLVTNECMRCICDASTFCNPHNQCSGGYCGPYLISHKYWIDSGKLGGDYIRCATNKTCAESLMQNYMRKYRRDCNSDGVIDCDDFAAIHQLGPNCASSNIYVTDYWNHFEYCSVMNTNSRREVQPISYFLQIRGPTEINQVSSRATRKPEIKKFNFPKYSVKPAKLKKQQLSNQLIDVNQGCLDCICEASSGCNANSSHCIGNGACGMYQFDKVYWSNAGRIGYRGAANDFHRCATNKRCADETVRGYMSKHALDCNKDGILNCVDFALMHAKGAKCAETDTIELGYWTRFETCYGFA